MTSADIAKLIRAERMRLGLSQAKLGKAVGLTQTHINDIEHGKSKPSLDALERLCAVLDLELIVRPIQNKPE